MFAEPRPVGWLCLHGRRLCQVLKYAGPTTDLAAEMLSAVPAVVGLIVPGPVVAPSLADVSLEFGVGATCGLTILTVTPCPDRDWLVLAEVLR